MKKITVFAFALLLAACASLEPPAERRYPSPREVADRPARHLQQAVTWGGVIVAAENRGGKGWLELVAYPLDSDRRPQMDEPSQGRFQAFIHGPIELLDFDFGRIVTLDGEITEVRAGRTGGTRRLFPILEVERYRLWPRRVRSPGPDIHFGIGFGFGF
jgi:outer membrane lipoprotein